MEPVKESFCRFRARCDFWFRLHAVYSSSPDILKDSIQWFNIVGNGYVKLVAMVVMPLVFISILGAVIRPHDASSLGKISILSIGTLPLTTFIAAFVGVMVTNLFGLSAAGLVQGTQETARLNQLNTEYISKVTDLSVPDLVLSFIPSNPFAELTGANPTSIISVVIFAVMLGIAGIKLINEEPEKRAPCINCH